MTSISLVLTPFDEGVTPVLRFPPPNHVASLIEKGLWEKAARYADPITTQAVNNNEEWIWHQLKKINDLERIDTYWNATSFGNVAYAILQGSFLPSRKKMLRN